MKWHTFIINFLDETYKNINKIKLNKIITKKKKKKGKILLLKNINFYLYSHKFDIKKKKGGI